MAPCMYFDANESCENLKFFQENENHIVDLLYFSILFTSPNLHTSEEFVIFQSHDICLMGSSTDTTAFC